MSACIVCLLLYSKNPVEHLVGSEMFLGLFEIVHAHTSNATHVSGEWLLGN